MNLGVLLEQYRKGERPLPGYAELIQVVQAGDIQTLTNEIVTWADSVFPDRQPQSALLKLFEETGELVRDPSSAGEYADICIMVFDLANMHGVDLAQAIREKLEINRARVWNRTSTGTLQHHPQNNNFPDCWVVIENGRIIGTHDEPGHLNGIEAVRYVPAEQFEDSFEYGHLAIKDAHSTGHADRIEGKGYGENIDPEWDQELKDWYDRGWHMEPGEAAD